MLFVAYIVGPSKALALVKKLKTLFASTTLAIS